MRAGSLAAACLVLLASGGCGSSRLPPEVARQAIAAASRFQEPQTQTIRTRYCSAAKNPGVPAVASRLQALQDAGAIAVERRPATAAECAGVAAPAQVAIVTLTPIAAEFHPVPLDGVDGWELPLGQRKLLSVGTITYNEKDPPTLAHVQYQWAWVPTLLGQLMQVSDAAQSASAAFRMDDGEWRVVDVGF
jgi:hypothetical protein